MAILSTVLVSESLSATLMMPFVGLFVAHLEDIPPSEAGYVSGLLISIYQLGQMLTGKLWGTASDRVGRKPMIQMGLLANAVVSIFFGLSPNLKFCIITRFIQGCANGNVLVAKTVIADITDKDTEGIGFAAISIFWGVGSVVGPALGGYLYNPSHHPVLGPRLFTGGMEDNDNIFVLHPALLPCVVISTFSAITLLVISHVLPETSRHPVDPFMSLFMSARHRERRMPDLAKQRSMAAASRSNDAEQIAVIEDEDDDENDVAEDAWQNVAAADNFSGHPSSALLRPPLLKKTFPCTNAPSAPEILNQAAALTSRTKDFVSQSPGAGRGGSTGRYGLSERLTSRAASYSSSVGLLQSARCGESDAPGQQRHLGEDVASPPLHRLETQFKEKICSDMPLLCQSREGASDSGFTTRASEPKAFGYREALALPTSRNVMIIYMCIASTESALLEVIPLWAIAEREKGGLGFSSSDIGALLCISSIVYVAVSLAFSRILKCLGGATRPLWDFSVLLWCTTSILTPCCAYLTDKSTIFYAAAVATSTREIGLSWCYSIMFMYVVRSAPDECAGSINGIAQSIASFSRMLTMSVIPPIFAWSLNGVTHPFPFNYHFVFWITCVPLLLSFVLSSILPLGQRRDRRQAHTSIDAVTAEQLRPWKAKVTPLQVRQLVAMMFVVFNESVSPSMLMPFVGALIAFLRGVRVKDAEYFSGKMIGVRMIDRVASAKNADTTVWMCAFFRFMHGLFNGNVLAAKTTPQRCEGAFWAGTGRLGLLRHPSRALLNSFVVFTDTDLGMLVCTFCPMGVRPEGGAAARVSMAHLTMPLAASDAQTKQISIDIIASDAGNAADPAKTKDAVTTCISNSSLTAPSEYEEKEKPVPKRLATAKPPPVRNILLVSSAPFLAAKALFRIVEHHYANKMRLLPLQMCISWRYSLSTMLTTRWVPQGHAGFIIEINYSRGALVRVCAPARS
ncbi:Major Facilitator Superfamily protein [Leishmania donovani]|uniref:Major Facilitator Superfamily protein n=1 Tax=Leishmania donovani TaxID=5661 RepID=A0A504X638_LEIDO|nr:Major Facilitator Superfamily protein [Leishmania donovani]